MSVFSVDDTLPKAPRKRIGTPAEFSLDILFAKQSVVWIGRGSECAMRLEHPTVSWRHATLERTPDGLKLSDLGSRNGTFVNSHRIVEPVAIHQGERFGIGPLLFSLDGNRIHAVDLSRGLRVEATDLDFSITGAGGQPRKLLDDVNLVIEPGEFVSVLGPSGAGKTTLMGCLNGRFAASRGHVLANGFDLRQHYHQFSQLMGYVPQRDIVHSSLTVERALRYTARLRLPRDFSETELGDCVENVIDEMELQAHRRTQIGNLSGGQIKRVSLGAELLADPSLLFIDEATSGLDAGIESRMMKLFRKLADAGRSLLCITHNVDNLDACHQVLILAAGKLMFFGPPQEAMDYFGVSRLGLIYDRLAEKDTDIWAQQFRQSRQFETRILSRLQGNAEQNPRREPAVESIPAPAPMDVEARSIEDDNRTSPPSQRASEPSGYIATVSIEPSGKDVFASLRPPARRPHLPRPARGAKVGGAVNADVDADAQQNPSRHGAIVARQWFQFRILTQRYVELLLRDRRSLRLLLLQAPIVALCVLMGFACKPYLTGIPLARPMNEAEHHVLLALQNVAGAANSDASGAAMSPAATEPVAAADPLAATEPARGQSAPIQSPATEPAATQPDLQVAIVGPKYTVNIPPWALAQVLGSSSDVQQIALSHGKTVEHLQVSELRSVLNEIGNSSGDANFSPTTPIVPSGSMIDPAYTYMLLNIICIVVFWFGCNNAAKEIVKELPIYTRERAANLRTLPYLASKLFVLSAVTALQAAALITIVYGALWMLAAKFGQTHPPAIYFLAPLQQLIVLVLLGIAGVALGLVLSTCVATPDRANALMPYVLIPQIIFGGAIVPLQGQPLRGIALTISPVCWAFQALHRGANLLPTYARLYQAHPYGVPTVCTALLLQSAALFAIAFYCLKRTELK